MFMGRERCERKKGGGDERSKGKREEKGRLRLDGGRGLSLPEVTVVVGRGRLVDVGGVRGIDVVLVDRGSSVRLVDAGSVVNERTRRTDSRGSGGGVVLSRRHGGDGSEVVLTSGALSAGAGEADGDGGPELASSGGDDEPDLGRDTDVGVGETEVVDSVSGNDEETKVETEGDDGYDEGEESEEGTENSENEVGAECEDESDEGDTSGDRGEDESVGKVSEDSLGGDVLNTGELRDELTRVSQLCARASSRSAPSPVTEGDVLTVDPSLEVSDVIPDRGGDGSDDKEGHSRQESESARVVDHLGECHVEVSEKAKWRDLRGASS